jgi:hypothetical protein
MPRPARIGWVIIHFADPVGPAIDFRGLVRPEGDKEWREAFRVKDHRDPAGWRGAIEPVSTDAFRLEIFRSINPVTVNAAQVSEIELCPPGKLTPIPSPRPPGDTISETSVASLVGVPLFMASPTEILLPFASHRSM